MLNSKGISLDLLNCVIIVVANYACTILKHGSGRVSLMSKSWKYLITRDCPWTKVLRVEWLHENLTNMSSIFFQMMP